MKFSQVGKLTSCTSGKKESGYIGLGYIKRQSVSEGDTVIVGDAITGTVVEVPFLAGQRPPSKSSSSWGAINPTLQIWNPIFICAWVLWLFTKTKHNVISNRENDNPFDALHPKGINSIKFNLWYFVQMVGYVYRWLASVQDFQCSDTLI